MPIKPPNLDDRRFEDILDEARSLIPQYCPEWTNLTDADPGMTLVQLFAWMTEMTIYRLNRVPDKTYVHFLNFIGEDRNEALPAGVPVTFTPRTEHPVELPAFTKVFSRQREGKPAQEFVTTEGLTVHNALLQRVMAVRGGSRMAVRELPFGHVGEDPSVLSFGSGRGVQLFDLDPVEYGPQAYTAHQYLYIGHEDLQMMGQKLADGQRAGRLRIRRPSGQTDEMSLINFFHWEYPTVDGWMPVDLDTEPDEILGMPEEVILTSLEGIVPISEFDEGNNRFAIPEKVAGEKYWIRGRVDYERWLSARMLDDLELSWQDDRGGDQRVLHNWEVRNAGRTLEFFLQDLPPMRPGWTIRMAMVDRSLPAGHSAYLPKYRWSYRRGEHWEPIADEHVRVDGTLIVLTGPFVDMASDGFNLRAERLETVFLRGLAPDLELNLNWVRPVVVHLFSGEEARRAVSLPVDEGPWSPFQMAPTVSPTIGQKWYVGSDLFDNRAQSPVLIELEVDFDLEGESVLEPEKDYKLQLTYRAEDNWRVVYDKKQTYAGFTFQTLDPQGAKKAGKRRIRIVINPATQLKGLARYKIGEVDTAWLRFELTKANLSHTKEDKTIAPISPRIHAIRLGADKTLGDGTYEQPLPNPSVAEVDHRQANQRLTRCLTRSSGRLNEEYPFFSFIDIEDEGLAVYLAFDKPLPKGENHALRFLCRGEAFLPDGLLVDWEMLQPDKRGRGRWTRLLSSSDEEEAKKAYQFRGSGSLEFTLPEAPAEGKDGFWLRARFQLPKGFDAENVPGLPPLTHILLNSVDAVNLVQVSQEHYSGLGVPSQVIELNQAPIFLHSTASEKVTFPRPELFPDIRVLVDEGEEEPVEWHLQPDGSMLTAGKDDRVFVVDPVDGTLTFGNGIRGKMLPVGTHNVIVDCYHQVPGNAGNLGPDEITICEGYGERVEVNNLLPAIGGRDAESVQEIIRRAPSLLTTRDRAVTRQDFEVIASEASTEVARAACIGNIQADGSVEVAILPHRREGEVIPDPFMAGGLREHCERHLSRRCLINVQPKVRLATFLPVDVSVDLRLRPNANQIQIREAAQAWVANFLDAYDGGLDKDGWPFGGTLFAQDFARMVTDIPGVRHVVDVQLYNMSGGDENRRGPGWEEGEGLEELALRDHDLFALRKVRIRTEEAMEA